VRKILITPEQPEYYQFAAHQPPLKIIYMDNHVIGAIKPPGVLSQADHTGDPDMVTILKSFIKNYFSKPGQVFLGLVHRLDQPVGGVMVFARTSKAAARLSEQIRTRKTIKRYGAICHGRPEPPTGEWQDNIHRHSSKNLSQIVCDPKSERGKSASTSYFEIAHDSQTDLSLLVLDLHSGRAHQIRVQAGARNIPLYADHKYGREKTKGDSGELALRSLAYGFKHPTRDELILLWDVLPDTNPWLLFSEEKEALYKKISESSIVS